MTNLYSWVDADASEAPKKFSVRRTFRLFLAVMGSALVAAIPLTILRFTIWTVDESRKEERRQEQLQSEINEVRKAVREGKAGEASNRLFAEDYDEYLRQKAEQDD